MSNQTNDLGEMVDARIGPQQFEAVVEVQRNGLAPLLTPPAGIDQRKKLHIATVIPPFRRGSGGHNTILQIVARLEKLGHSCSVWLHDPGGEHGSEWPAVVRQNINDYFVPLDGPVFKGFDEWFGADVVMATGWQTAHPVALLKNCYARTYMINDHEPEFYPQSADSLWAQDTYRLGMHHLFCTPWLREQLGERYGAKGSEFVLGIDLDVYQPQPVQRRQDTVVCYMRASTARRAVGLSALALEELKRRRPDVRIVLFGETSPPWMTFPYEYGGVMTPEQLASLYSEATVGLSLSMTNFSLIPKEMMACGLPVVELAGFSAESIFGQNGPITLADFNADSIATEIERLLDSAQLREQVSKAASEWVSHDTYEQAAAMVDQGLRQALKQRLTP